MLLHTTGNVGKLVSHDMVAILSDLNKAADGIADRLFSGPLEFPLHPVAAGT
ncbi:hypothetical protein D3C80_2239580 [compost metagenome]